jgi:ankyrin repeat protein
MYISKVISSAAILLFVAVSIQGVCASELTDNQEGKAFLTAMLANNYKEAKRHLEKIENLDMKTKDGVTFVYVASYVGSAELVKYLVGKNVDIKTPKADPVDAAIVFGHLDVLKELAKSPQFEEIVRDGYVEFGSVIRPIDSAVSVGNPEMVEFLLRNGSTKELAKRTLDSCHHASTEKQHTACKLIGAEE